MTEWITCKISDIGDVVGGATPSTKDESNYDGDIAWLTPKDLSTYSERFIEKGERSITQKGFNSCSTKMLPVNSVLFSSRAPIGYIAITANEMCTNQGFKSIIPNEKVNYMFLYYLLKYKKNEIEGMGSGTTFKEVSGNVMKNIEVKIPQDIDAQKRIAKILDNIDSKIENNNQINRNLSEQAMAIFTDLFGDADKDATVDEVSLNVTDGVHNTVKDDSEGKFFLLSCKNIKGGSLSLGEAERRINQETFEKLRKRTKLEKGDILLSSVGTIGELLLMSFDPDKYEFQRSVAIIKPNSDVVSSEYLYCALLAQKQEIIRAAHGAVQQCIFISDIKGFTIHKPTSERLIQFDNAVVPMMKMIYQNEEENKRLSLLRDTLLPKLMSGELDVSELDI